MFTPRGQGFDPPSLHFRKQQKRLKRKHFSLQSFFVSDSYLPKTDFVEWDQQEGIIKILEKFENEADVLASEMGLLLVCAYEAEGVPDWLVPYAIARYTKKTLNIKQFSVLNPCPLSSLC